MRMTSARLFRFSARPVAFAAAALLGAMMAACSSSPSAGPPAPPGSSAPGAVSFPATISAANGTVRVAARPAAIISLSATATEMLYAIGAGDQVKAVDQYSTYPPQAPRTSLSGFAPNVEAIAARKPDLVVIDSDKGGLTKRLAAFSTPVLVLPPAARLADVYHELDELGVATGHRAQAADKAASIRTELDRIVAAAPKSATPPTYYYELEPDFYSATSSTFVGQLLGLLGLRSIADRVAGTSANGGFPQLSAEYIIKASPDYIFLADTVCCRQSAATVAARPGWSRIEAVAAHRIVPLNDDIASRWGPRIVDLLRAVAAALEGNR